MEGFGATGYPGENRVERGCTMAKRTRPLGEIEGIVEEIEVGSIAEVDDIEGHDLELLRTYCGDGDDLEDLLDSVRGTDRVD